MIKITNLSSNHSFRATGISDRLLRMLHKPGDPDPETETVILKLKPQQSVTINNYKVEKE